jgi:hypothetical protein
MRHLFALALIVALAACSTTAVASPTAEATNTPSPVTSPSEPSAAPTAEADLEPNGTITLGDFGIADGPGESVTAALAHAGADPRLVTGILLKDADDDVWLCEELADADTPQCDEPRLLVTNYPPDHEVVNGEDSYTVFFRDPPATMVVELHEEDGVRWVEGQQLFGIVEAAD